MSQSSLQEPFLYEFASNFLATKKNLENRLAEASAEDVPRILDDELRGLYHGLFVILDGGTVLAEKGLIRIHDEEGKEFDRFLHEICFRYWKESDLEVTGIDLNIPTQEIIDIVREGRERQSPL